jgi:hypothetical protein
MARKRTTIAWHYAHGLRAAVRFNAQAFGFSIVVTSAFGIVAAFEGTPTVGEAYAFMSGAVLGFVAVLVVATAGFTRTAMEAERTEILAIATALALGSTASGLGAATLVVHFLGGWLAWGLAPFVASAMFLLVLGLEFAVVEEVED